MSAIFPARASLDEQEEERRKGVRQRSVATRTDRSTTKDRGIVAAAVHESKTAKQSQNAAPREAAIAEPAKARCRQMFPRQPAGSLARAFNTLRPGLPT